MEHASEEDGEGRDHEEFQAIVTLHQEQYWRGHYQQCYDNEGENESCENVDTISAAQVQVLIVTLKPLFGIGKYTLWQ